MRAAGLRHLIVLLFVSDGVLGWCLYFCTDDPRDRTLCAVDPVQGARLFRGRCHMQRTNYCQSVGFVERDMTDCLSSRRPDAVARWVAGRESARQFDARRDAWAVGPFRRFFLLFNLLSRVMPVPPPPAPKITPNLASMPFPFPFPFPFMRPGLSPFPFPRPPIK